MAVPKILTEWSDFGCRGAAEGEEATKMPYL